ncbi:hypothetical protein NQL31_002182 [Lotmaria passim]
MQARLCLRGSTSLRWWIAPPSKSLKSCFVRWHGDIRNVTGCDENAELCPSKQTESFASSSSPAAAAAPASSKAESPNTGTSASTAFAYLFNDVFTTIDIAPVKRPQLLGSLQCSVDDFPFTLLLVENCTGTTNEGVTHAVQQRAVHAAQYIRTCTGQSVRGFLLNRVCESWPRVMRHLRSLDLSLQLRLVLVESAAQREGKAGEEKDAVPSSSSPPSPSPDGTADNSNSAVELDTPASSFFSLRWQCSASLYDPWQTQPQFTPLCCVQRGRRGGRKGSTGDTLSIEGDLQVVLSQVMHSVMVELSARCAAQVAEAAAEAARFVGEAGREHSQLWVTSSLQAAAHASLHRCFSCSSMPSTHAACPQWLRDDMPSSSTWALSCQCWVDASRSVAVGSQVRLERVATSADSHTVLADAVVNRVLVPLVVKKATSEEEDCVFSSEAALSTHRQLPLLPQRNQQAPRKMLTESELAARLHAGTIALKAAWANTPLSACDDFVKEAARLSPTIAYDWIGSERCGDDGVAARSSYHLCESTATLPDLVRWTSFEGRRAVNAYLGAAEATTGVDHCGCGDSACCCCSLLPPLWPRITTPAIQPTEADRYGAFRELLRTELGVRHLPRIHLGPFAAAQQTQVVFACDADIAELWDVVATPADTAAANSRGGGVKRLRIGAEWYADVAAAAQVHTPWALPLCTPLPPRPPSQTPAAAAAAAAPAAATTPQKTSRRLPAAVKVHVLCVPDSLRRRGVVRATWDKKAKVLLCYRDGAQEPWLRFSNLTQVKGLVSLLRFCSKSAEYVQKTVLTRGRYETALPRLLRLTMTGSLSFSKREVGSSDSVAAGEHDDGGGGGGSGGGRDDSLSDDGLCIALVPLPFHAGTVRLLASSRLACAAEKLRLLTFLQHFSADPTSFAPLLAAAPPAASTFFHFWAITGPWLQPRGPLLVGLTRCETPDEKHDALLASGCDAALNDNVAIQPSSLLLCIDVVPSEWDRSDRISNDGAMTTTAECASNVASSSSSLPVLRKQQRQQQQRVRLPAAGSAWIVEAYAAIRAALFSQPHMVTDATQKAAKRQQLLVLQCANFAQLVQATLCNLLNDNYSRSMNATRLFLALVGNMAKFELSESQCELRLSVTADVEVCLASLSRPCTEKAELHQPKQNSAAVAQKQLCVAFFRAAAPDVLDALEQTRRLQLYVSEKKKALVCALDMLELRLLWRQGPPTAAAAAVETDKRTPELLFTVEVLQARTSPQLPSSSPGSCSERCVLYSASSALLAEVLERVLQDYLMKKCAVEGFLPDAQRVLAWHHQLERVALYYDAAVSRLQLIGWENPHDSNNASADRLVTLASEETAWSGVPQAAFRMHRRLLRQFDRRTRFVPLSELLEWSSEDLRHQIMAALNCEEEVLQATAVFRDKRWYCMVVLPGHLFRLSPPPTPGPEAVSSTASLQPPCSFYVTCCGVHKRKTLNALFVCLCHWTCYADSAEVNYTETYGVRCGTTYSAPFQTREDLERPKGFLADPAQGVDGWNNVAAPAASVSSGGATPTPPAPRRTTLARRGQASSAAVETAAAAVRVASLRPTPAVTGSAAKVCMLDGAHAKVTALLRELVGDEEGLVVLKVSQTFGLELIYEVTSTHPPRGTADSGADKEDAQPAEEAKLDGCVLLLRESWATDTWAPAQILRAEAAVLTRLACRDPHASTRDHAQCRHAVLAGLLDEARQPLRSLHCGPDVSRRDFCVLFLRRYFGWRVCEQEDLADLPVNATQSNTVVYERVVAAAAKEGGYSGGGGAFSGMHKRRARRVTVTRASLCLGQIIEAGKPGVRLAQVLVEVEDLDAGVARELLWDECARRIKEVFGVSRLMTTAEVDAGMLRFMEEELNPQA